MKNPDILILPGSKNTIEDLKFLKESGIAQKIVALHEKKQVHIIGICGGYQMLGLEITDPEGIESSHHEIEGLSLLPLRTTMKKDKTTVLSEGSLNFNDQFYHVKGYEIHMGETKVTDKCLPLIQLADSIDGCKTSDEQVIGTYFHGIFHNDDFRKEYLNSVRMKKGLTPIDERTSFNQLREEAFDLLADHVRKHVDLTFIQHEMERFHQRSVKIDSHI